MSSVAQTAPNGNGALTLSPEPKKAIRLIRAHQERTGSSAMKIDGAWVNAEYVRRSGCDPARVIAHFQSGG
ncbi:MAG: hypothetical protein HY320_05000 [Armatimonadetes bacterium]|nr:hypothetical protein [Armatimonadota bacterium]